METPKFVQEDPRFSSLGAPVDFDDSALASLTGRPRAPAELYAVEDPTKINESAHRVFEDFEQIYAEVGISTPPPYEPPRRGRGGEGGPPPGDQNEPDVDLTPEGRLVARYLKWAFILIITFLAVAALGIMVISFIDYGISMRALAPGINLDVYNAYLETTKDISDLAIDRLSNILTLSLGILVGLFLGIVEKFPRNRDR